MSFSAREVWQSFYVVANRKDPARLALQQCCLYIPIEMDGQASRKGSRDRFGKSGVFCVRAGEPDVTSCGSSGMTLKHSVTNDRPLPQSICESANEISTLPEVQSCAH